MRMFLEDETQIRLEMKQHELGIVRNHKRTSAA